MRTAEERDQQTLLIVQALVRFFGVVALTLCALAAAQLTVGIDHELATWLLTFAIVMGIVLAVSRLLAGRS